MRSLLVAPTLPSDAGNGLAMRIGIFLEALCRLGEVELVVVPIFGMRGSTNALCRRLDIRPRFLSQRADTQFAILRSLSDQEARLDAFARYGRPSLTAHLSVPVLQDLRDFVAARRFDLVHIARSYLLPAIDVWPEKQRPPVSVDLDEDDVETQRRIAKLHVLRGDEFAGKWLEAEAVALDRLIARWLPSADGAFVSTRSEREALAVRYRVVPPIVVPNAVAIPPKTVRDPSGCALLFVGGFGYFPNLDAALWVLEAVLPALRDRLGEPVSMTMVGGTPPPRLSVLAARLGVDVLDDVRDLSPVYARSTVALVPVRAGGGSRIKLLEAAAHCVPVVATSIGAENSGLTDGREIWIADTPGAIVEACLDISRNPAEAGRRAEAAKAFVEAHRSRSMVLSTLRASFARGFAAGQAVHGGDMP
jgi:glycosyltransferase involved in cell wall biosynthesis